MMMRRFKKEKIIMQEDGLSSGRKMIVGNEKD